MTRKRRLTLAAILAVAALGFSAPAASAYLYWIQSDGTIGRANLDGSKPNQSFITGGTSATPRRIDIDDDYIYWTNYGDGTVGRANLNGTGVNQAFIRGASGAVGLAVDRNFIFWTNPDDGNIGRANLDGTGVDSPFIHTRGDSWGVAVDGTYIYWTNTFPRGSDYGRTIGRANIFDGTDIDQSFITGATDPFGVAVDRNHVYWTRFILALGGTNPATTIGRASIDGTGKNQSFIGINPYIAYGLAVDRNHIYWASGGDQMREAIGRSKLDGSNPNQFFMSFPDGPAVLDVAVDSRPKPTLSRVGKPTRRSLKVKIGCGDASACALRVRGRRVGVTAALVPRTVSVGPRATRKVKLAYTKALRRALVKGGRVRVTVANKANGGTRSIVIRVSG